MDPLALGPEFIPEPLAKVRLDVRCMRKVKISRKKGFSNPLKVLTGAGFPDLLSYFKKTQAVPLSRPFSRPMPEAEMMVPPEPPVGDATRKGRSSVASSGPTESMNAAVHGRPCLTPDEPIPARDSAQIEAIGKLITVMMTSLIPEILRLYPSGRESNTLFS